jgi:hypothetical protein
MSDEENPDPLSFDARAAINEYLAKPWPDYSEVAKDTVNRGRDYVNSPQFQQDALTSVHDAIQRMRRQTGQLDAVLQPRANRAVEANREWIAADKQKRKALAAGNSQVAAQQELTQQGIERELETFEMWQSIKASTAATAKTLSENQADRIEAEKEHKRQAKFNKLMTITAIVLAVGSMGTGIVMPVLENFVWKKTSDPAPTPEVVVIRESDLVVPPLLRRITIPER